MCSILSHVSCGWGHFLGEPEERDAGAGLVGSLYGGQGGPASPPRKPGAASQQINLGGGGRGCLVRLASPWRSCRPQTLSLAGFHSSSGWQLPPRAPVGPETRGERATTVGVLAAERRQALRLLIALAQVRMGRREEREDERMATSSSKSSHSRNNKKMLDFTVCLLLFVIAFCFETAMTITDRE